MVTVKKEHKGEDKKQSQGLRPQRHPNKERLAIRCYLDMDGLLANLFDFVSFTMHNKPYDKLSKEEKLKGKEVWENHSLFRQVIGDVEDVFTKLPPYATNDILLNTVSEKFGGFYLCSRPTKLDYKACIKGKLAWIEAHILPQHEHNLLGIVFPTKKEIYAKSGLGTPNVLIDDYGPYLASWQEKGGIGIKIQSGDFKDIDSFQKHLTQELQKVPDLKQVKSQPNRSLKAKFDFSEILSP